MIDPTGRLRAAARAGATTPTSRSSCSTSCSATAAHEDPAGPLAPVCAELMAGGGPQVVAYVLGTEADPQGTRGSAPSSRRPAAIVPQTNARAACAAAATRAAASRAGRGGRRERCRPVALRHLLDQAARRRGAHAGARRGAARRGCAGAGRRRSATRRPASSARCARRTRIVPGPAGARRPRGRRSPPASTCLQRGPGRRRGRRSACAARPGLHRGPGRRAGPGRRVQPVAGGPHRAPRRRLHQPGAHRLPARRDPRARRGPRRSASCGARSSLRDYGVSAASCRTASTSRGSAPADRRRAAELRAVGGRGRPAAAAGRRRDRAAQGQRHPGAGARRGCTAAPAVAPVLAVVGGHSFQDHRAYRDAVLAELPRLGLELGGDVVARRHRARRGHAVPGTRPPTRSPSRP